jgi:hypothetical protein
MKSRNPNGRPPVPLEKRFWSSVDRDGRILDSEKYPDISGRCWKWAGCKSGQYGTIFDRAIKKMVYAHRVSWFLHFGIIPEGMCICHKCDNPECCNPGHLFLGTCRDNAIDKIRKGRDYRGERVNTAKLTPISVRVARRLRGMGFTFQRIADVFGISKQHSIRIVKMRSWNHVS